MVIVPLMASHVFAKMDMTRFYSQYFIGVRERKYKSRRGAPLLLLKTMLNTNSRNNKGVLQGLHKESPNMSYQANKVKLAMAATWDSMYEKWERKPGKEFREDWIASNSNKLINLCMACATGLACRACATGLRRGQGSIGDHTQWVDNIFFGEDEEEEEDGEIERIFNEAGTEVEPLGNPVGIVPAVGCMECNAVLTALSDPDNKGFCKDCQPAAKSIEETAEFIYGYSHERCKAFKQQIFKNGKRASPMYAEIFVGNDTQYVQAKFPESDPITITDITLDEFKEMQKVKTATNKGLISSEDIEGGTVKLSRSSAAWCGIP